MKKLSFALIALLALLLVSTTVFANYDPYLRFFLYAKKQKACKGTTLCTDASQFPQSVRVKNSSPYRYRCTGQLKVTVTEGDRIVNETIRVDKFVQPNADSFILRKYLPGQKLSDLDTSSVDCTAI